MLCVLVLHSPQAEAGIRLSNSRIIMLGQERDADITLSNASDEVLAVQVWIENAADELPLPPPFAALPALFRLDPGTTQLVRVSRTAGSLPADRESLFYFNAQEIPAQRNGARKDIEMALRTRIKLIHRPEGLKGTLLQALPQLQWSVVRHAGKPALKVRNPSPFHVSFLDIGILRGKRLESIKSPLVVAPFAERYYPLDGLNHDPPDAVVFSAINDHGGYSEPVRARLARSDAG
jgi:chaperone protein EcpD